jgi:hypothetical protein
MVTSMRSSFDVSFGLTTPDGVWIGIRLKRKIDTSVADRNVDVELERQKTEGGPLTYEKRPSDCTITTPGADTEENTTPTKESTMRSGATRHEN